jgi:hypothetical protein
MDKKRHAASRSVSSNVDPYGSEAPRSETACRKARRYKLAFHHGVRATLSCAPPGLALEMDVDTSVDSVTATTVPMRRGVGSPAATGYNVGTVGPSTYVKDATGNGSGEAWVGADNANESGQASGKDLGKRHNKDNSEQGQRDGDANDADDQHDCPPYGPDQGTCNCPTLAIGPRASFGLAPVCGMPRFRSCACCPHTPCLRHTVEAYQEPVIGSPIDGMLAGVCQCCESDRRPHWRATSSRSNERATRVSTCPVAKPLGEGDNDGDGDGLGSSQLVPPLSATCIDEMLEVTYALRVSLKKYSFKKATKCPSGHGLKQWIVPDNDDDYVCDLCVEIMAAGYTLWGCRECEWDCCATCFTQATATTVPKRCGVGPPSADTTVPMQRGVGPLSVDASVQCCYYVKEAAYWTLDAKPSAP